MADSALGSALFIPESALKKIKEADDKLKQLQRTAEQTASSVKSSFGTMQGSTSGFIGALDQIIQKLGTINNASSKMSGSLSNIGANKASKDVSQMNGVIIQASENIDRMVASQRKATNSADFSKSVSDWQNIQAQIDATNKRQQELTQSMRQYEMVQKNIRDGKGGIVYKDDKIAYAANQKEFESNQQLIASLREKQQAIIANNQALNQQIQLLNSLKNYHIESGSLDNLRSKDTLASMREYYKEQEKLSAQQEKQRQKEANAWLKNKEKESQAAEKASRREQEASDKAAAKAEKDASRIRAAQEKAYMSDWLKQQRKAFYSNTNAVIADTNGAKTLRDHIAAIKDLQQARLSLNTTDKNYKQNLASVNEAIKQHSKVLKEAGVNAKSLGEQTSYIAGYLSRLAQRTAVVFSFGAAKSFVEQIAEVRGQFELSERSLEAILQNKPKADEIFNKTVELAVKSPFRIKDLVDYTRQLSAYRIESDKLYDTTKRLADVSAGLGVDMGRLILAYGQVKAAAYLRGSEVRQFTEAGINMYGELQQYFKEVKGEAYTTAQIVDMISKHKVTFEDVEAIFQRMTDKGGTFYNMQEIQAETLQGKISNLKDAFDVMLNDIGKANEGIFKGMISGATELLKHWESIKNVGIALASVLSIMYLQSKKTGVAFSAMFTSNVAANATKNLTNWNLITSGIKSAGAAALTFGKNLKYALASNIYTIAIAAVFSALYKLYSLYSDYNEKIEKLNAEHVKERAEVFELARQYAELGKAVDDANSKEQSYSKSDSIEKKRAIIEKLIKSLNDKGFDIKLNVLGLNEKELDEALRTFQTKLLQFQDLTAKARRKIYENQDGFISDGITTDANQYNDAVDEMLSNTEKIDQAVNILKINYQSLNGTAKKYLHSVKQNKEDYADELEYYKAMQEAIRKVIQLSGEGSGIWEQLVPLQKSYSGLFADITSKAEEFDNELKNSLGWLNKIADKKTVELVLDTIAAEEGWNSWSKKHAKEYFKVTARLDTTQAKNDIASIKEQMDKAFANNTYHITFTYDPIKLDPKSAYGEFDAEAQEQLKKLQELVTKRHNLKGGTMKLAGYNEAATTREINDLYKDISQLGQGYKEAADRIMGYNKTRKNTTKHDKAQRDIQSEQISLLKEMNKQYEQLDKYMDDDSAAQSVMKHYAANLKYVGMPNKVVKGFVPDKQGLIQALKQIEPTIKDFKKRAQLKNDIVELQIQLDTEFFQQQLNDVKNEISKSFDQLNLYKKLQGEGLSDGLIKSMFGDLTSSFNDVRKGIEDQFTAKFGNNTKWSSDIWKQYQEQMDKLDKEVYQDQVNQAQELIKAYKQQLSDQLQLDKWYIEEKQKIQNNAIIAKNPELQKQLQENLTAQYKKKTGENTWKNFQGSDMYVKIFENLDHTSTKVLDYMIQRLQSLRDEMKNLDPTQVKAITEQISKLQETRNSRNPFKAFTSGMKELVKYTKEYKKLGGDNALISTSDKYDKEEKNIENQGKIIANLDAEYNKSMLLNGLDDEKTKTLKTSLDLSKNQLDNMKKQHSETKDTLDILNNVQGETDNAKNKFSKSVTDITSIVSSMATAFNGLFEALGGSDEQLENTLSVVDNIGQAIGSYYSGNYAGVVSGAMGALTGVAKLFSNEGKIDKEIARQERAVNSLQHAYEKLKKSMDDAFDTQKLYEYNQKSVDALKKQQKAYQAMINAERGRKKPDEGKIQEWEQQIDDLNTTIKELGESMTEALGGFGSQSNYKSAAEAFSEAWVDAFNEGSDALEALNNKFDEYFNTMLTKQLMNRATSKYIQPILEAFDKAVSEGSEGGNNGLDVTKKELEGIKELKDKNLALFNEYAKNLMDVLNVKPNGSSNISALQQGIQSVTESTAQALESILNSCRWYIAQQQADIRIIRDTLLEKLGNSISAITQDTSSSPVLIELRLQTTILTDIRDTLASCVKGGHKQGRNGIKVFMN
nr:MAG TPA: tail tape measure [Caudoviricetes sp.]